MKYNLLPCAESGDLLLASCSQDASIRLWRITLVKSDHAAIAVSGDELQVVGNVFNAGVGGKQRTYAATLESVLTGKSLHCNLFLFVFLGQFTV